MKFEVLIIMTVKSSILWYIASADIGKAEVNLYQSTWHNVPEGGTLSAYVVVCGLVGIATRLWAEQQGFDTWQGQEIFLFPRSADGLCCPHSYQCNGYQGLYPWG
jgi:hypothetical protein